MNSSMVRERAVQSTRSGTDVPDSARPPDIPDCAWLGRGSVDDTKASRAGSATGIAWKRNSIRLAMMVVAAIETARVTTTTAVEPDCRRTVRSACRRPLMNSDHGEGFLDDAAVEEMNVPGRMRRVAGVVGDHADGG